MNAGERSCASPVALPSEAAGIFFVTDRLYGRQAVALVQRLRSLGVDSRIGALAIDSLTRECGRSLINLGCEMVEWDARGRPGWMNRSGLKLWIPCFFESEYYILLDTDLAVFSPDLLRACVRADESIALVEEDYLTWGIGDKGIGQFHADLMGRPVFQTGLIGIGASLWRATIRDIRQICQDDPSECGDMAAINLFARRNPDAIVSLPPEVCLVWRLTGKGASTREHLKHIRAEGGVFTYRGRPILSAHYTASAGRVVQVDDYDVLLGQGDLECARG